MNEEAVRQFDRYLPRLSKRVAEALSNEVRRAVFGFVASRGSKSFSEIMRVFEVNQGTLSRHLVKLEVGGLISNYYRRTVRSREFSFYEATDFGKSIVNALAMALNPRPRIEEIGAESVKIYDAEGLYAAPAARRFSPPVGAGAARVPGEDSSFGRMVGTTEVSAC